MTNTRLNSRDGLRYVWIPPGAFVMGASPEQAGCCEDERPAHAVTITRGFWISQSLVTQNAYRKIMGTNPSDFHSRGKDLPVNKVSWDDARRYCELTGGRLPTEAEWEWATGWWIPQIPGLMQGVTADVVMRYAPQNGMRLSKKAVLLAIVRGAPVRDMLGNFWQWTADWYGPYEGNDQIDPKGPGTGEKRVMRGGGSTTVRFPNPAHASDLYTGVRCVVESL